MTAHDLPLGRTVAYPERYDPSLLFPIDRQDARAALGLDGGALPFTGLDRWHAYELSWLDPRGKPVVETATFLVPADSPRLVESKSLKLYLNSLNRARFAHREDVRSTIATDLSSVAGAPVSVTFGLPPVASGADDASGDLDRLELDCDAHVHPEAALLHADAADVVEETLHSALLKSNCPVTAQPDWASVRIAYRGPRIDRAGLLHYLVSFREHAGFHEQCVERIFVDLMARCRPGALSVEARFTRRGGLDINPWRATPGMAPPVPGRDPRQ
jgi:7-cyano-7-deazaguanine reductase